MATKGKGLGERMFDHVVDRIKAMPKEISAGFTDKIIPHGANELAAALNTGNGFVLYGSTQYPLDVREASAGAKPAAPEQAAPAVEPTPAAPSVEPPSVAPSAPGIEPAPDYGAMMDGYARPPMETPAPEQGMDR